MQITLTKCTYTPRWDTMQSLIREASNDPTTTLIRISRKDRGVDYRKTGEYELEFRRSDESTFLVNLSVEA